MEGKVYCVQLVFLCSLIFLTAVSDYQGVRYRVKEGEPNTMIGHIATDFNFSAYANESKSLRFSLQTGVSYFNISETTGDLYTIGALDREEICNQRLEDCIIPVTVIVTSNKFSIYEKTSFNVSIEDVNDYEPRFLDDFKSVSFQENSPIGTTLILDGAVDLDSPKYSVKSFIISPANVPFKTNISQNLEGRNNVHIVVNGELDREKADSYQIQIIAIDGGMPPKNGTLNLNITIVDINDNAPTFINTVYNITVNDSIEISPMILQVSANDLDIGENGRIVYRLAAMQKKHISSLFVINAETGKITTTGQLVYNPGGPYQIIVEAGDCGTPSITTQVLVYIQVQNSENNPPKIQVNLLSSSNNAKVSELANLGVVVAVIVVSDNDVGFNGVTNCSMASDAFSLQKSDTNEYKVVVAKTLSQESNSLVSISVFCADNGMPPLNTSANFNVFVVDENDHKPKFLQPNYTAEIMENNIVGESVVRGVSSTDADYGENAEISYELHGEFLHAFMLQPDGIITALKSFDREYQGHYEFSVLAIDHGDVPQTSIATVTVNILDKNDNKPKFTLAYYEFSVQENKPENEFVGKLVAEDADIGNNGLVSYRVDNSGDINVPFSVDPNGVLRITRSLDREVHDRYDFTIIATDQGSPQRLNSSVNVTVFVLDLNDNNPFIVSPEKSGCTVYVSLSTPVNVSIYAIVANDLDTGNNSKLSYKIEDRNDSNLFAINDSGHVFVSHLIEKWQVNSYTIQVAVHDNGQPQNFAKTRLLMDITTDMTNLANGLHSQNLLIAVSVVIVTVVLAVSIMVTIFLIRRLDKKKRSCFGADPNSKNLSDSDVCPESSLPKQTDFYCQQIGNMLQQPVVSPIYANRTFATKDNVNKPRMNTPTPSEISQSDHQLNDKQLSHDQNIPRLGKQASLPLHQNTMMLPDKQWSNHNDSVQSNDVYLQRPKWLEDTHSQVSEDDDSGQGGSLSDGLLGLSQDGDDLHIAQLSNIVLQTGRHGLGPQMKNHTTNDKYNLSMGQKQCNLMPKENQKKSSTIFYINQSNSKNYGNKCISKSQTLKQSISRTNKLKHLNSNIGIQNSSVQENRCSEIKTEYVCSNSDNFHVDNSQTERPMSIQQHPFNQDNSYRNINCENSCQKGKTSPGIQMGLSSFSNFHHSYYKNNPTHEHLFGTFENDRHKPTYLSESNKMAVHSEKNLDESLNSISTTMYDDDDDNTTTSGSYTIDNNISDDFLVLNVAHFKDMFV